MNLFEQQHAEFIGRHIGPNAIETAEMLKQIKMQTVDELIEEHNRNSERMGLRDEEGGSAITYQEFQDLSKRQAELEDIIEGAHGLYEGVNTEDTDAIYISLIN